MPSPGFVPIDAGDDVPSINVGLLGYNFMAKAHTNAYKKIPYIFWPPAARPRLHAICGRTTERVAEAASRYGYAGYYTSWEAMVDDPDVQLFDNCSGHHMHVEPSIAALRAGKHVVCEKPLALTAADARRMRDAARDAVRAAGTKHMCGFNYRFVPAIRLARDLIERGLLGDIYHFRTQYLQQSIHDPDRPMRKAPDPASRMAGSQAILGCHAFDIARFLVGEPATISALAPRFVPERRGPDNTPVRIEWDDASISLVEFAHGAVGTIEASRVATGRANSLKWEINGSRGSLAFDLERLNELQVFLADAPVAEVVGFQDVMVTQANHPFASVWWPHGHIVGWEHAHINELNHVIEAIVHDRDVAPYGATFEDGYRAAVIAEVIAESAASGRRLDVRYET
ncbi:MAG: Gfo/Idh/MocA family oxidoreductase [Chloroflexia bacterium]|nr:Gfo/Idh/MocA family oxidoreductase [Chloroflexia bacterium]